MKILISELQFKRIINELSLGHKDGYALIDGKPYKIKKSIITVNVDKLTQNKDGSASLSWSAVGKSGNETISPNSVNQIIRDIEKYGKSEMDTKMGKVNIIPK